MKESDWIEDEIQHISDDNSEFEEVREKKRTQKLSKLYDKRIFIIFMLFLLPLLTTELISRETYRRQVVQSAQWRCKQCGINTYSENPDWKGDFYCRRCGTKK